MTKTEQILNALRTVNWTAAPQSATQKDFEGATAFLRMYADFILENESNQNLIPFASPLKVLGTDDVHVQQSIVDECLLLTGQSPLAYDKVFAMRALEWAALIESGHSATRGRENLFDPLIELVVNRVPAMIRKDHWVVDESMYPLLDWVKRYGSKSNRISDE